MNTNTNTIAVPTKTNIERSVSDLLKVISFSPDGQAILSDGADVKPNELGRLGASLIIEQSGARDKLCGVLVLSEGLPPVSVDTGTTNGNAPILKLVKAQDYVISLITKETDVSISLLREAIGLLPKYKIALANGWKPSAYYDAQSVLTKLGSVGSDNKLIAPSATETLKLEAFNAVKKALDDNLPTSNGLRRVIEAEKANVNAAIPGTFPSRGAKSKVATASLAAAAKTAPVVETTEVVHNAKTVEESFTRIVADMKVGVTQCEKAMDAFKGSAKEKRASIGSPENWELVKQMLEYVKGFEAMIRPLK